MGIAAAMVGAGHRPARLMMASTLPSTAAQSAAVWPVSVANRAGRCPVPTITATLLLE